MASMPANCRPSYVRAIAPYQPGKPISELARELGLEEASIVKLASNENPLRHRPAHARRDRGALGELARYPDGNGFELKHALSRALRRRRRRASCSATAPTTCSSWWRAPSSAPGDVGGVLAARVRGLSARHAGARRARIVVPAQDYGHDLDAMAAAMRRRHATWSGSPIRTIRPARSLRGRGARGVRRSACRERVLVVLDEAYNEYLPPELQADTRAVARALSRTWSSRARFSKAYGLAGPARRLRARASRRWPT